LTELLQTQKLNFTTDASKMPDISTKIATHQLRVDPTTHPVHPKKEKF